MRLAGPTFLAIDWGTTNRRIYAIDAAGAVIATEHDDRGLLAMAGRDFAVEVAAIRARLGDVPVLCAGMVGSAQGWVQATYVACPADLAGLARALLWVEPGRAAIVPGLSSIDGGRGDVMRGEEVQLLGAVAAGLAPDDGMLCQPGTHCKWARIAGGQVASFRTTMTGELFALLGQHSLLAELIRGEVADGPAFRQGLADSGRARLLGDLFGARADGLLGLRPRDQTAAYVSGLLIGADVREQALAGGETVHVLAEAALGALYATAIEVVGGRVVMVDGGGAFVAGINAIWRLAHGS